MSDNTKQNGGGVLGQEQSAEQLAVAALEKLERLCQRDQADMNERRNVAYFNALAKCYMSLKMKESAMRALDESVAISASPIRNPAVFMRSTLGRDPSKFLLKGGMYAALGVGLIAMVVSLARSN